LQTLPAQHASPLAPHVVVVAVPGTQNVGMPAGPPQVNPAGQSPVVLQAR
jgi:hypothetical protein